MRRIANAGHNWGLMRALALLLAAFLLGTGIQYASAQGVLGAKSQELPYEKLGPMMNNLPAGSMLREVRIPIFDKRLERMALLQSSFLKVITKRDLVAENITLRYFQDDSILLRMRMKSADFSLTDGVLKAHQAVTLDTKKLEGSGTGGVFHLESRSGFIRGPAFTRFTSESLKQPKPAAGAESLARSSPSELSALAAAFTGPEGLTARESRIINSLLGSRTKSVIANRAPTRNFMTQSRQFTGRADTDLRSFSNTVEISEARLLGGSTSQPEPLLSGLKHGEIMITAEGGIFLNPQRGHISYLRNIQILDPRFTVSGGGHLKVFFPPRELTEFIKESDQPPALNEIDLEGGGGPVPRESFSELVDPYLLVVSGGVRLEINDSSRINSPMVATGETVVIDRRSGDIVLQGGTPSITRGSDSLTAKDPDLYLRIYENGDIYAEEGPWTTIGNLAQDRTSPENILSPNSTVAAGGEDAESLVTISCHGGLYLDASEGEVVYLKDIQVVHSKFHVEAEDEIKIFLGKNLTKTSGIEAFSDIEHIVASGRVRLTQQDPDKGGDPVKATAEHVIVDVKGSNIILKGGTPFLGIGDNFLRAGTPELYLRIYQNGSLFAEPGPWMTTGKLSENSSAGEQAKNQKEYITITCEGGVSFDSLKGQIMYFGEIVAEEPRFRLRCDKSMRITLSAKDGTNDKSLEGPEAFSDVDKIVALGNVMISRIPEVGAQPVVARSAAVTYEAATGTLALRGGRPAIRQGKSYFAAQEDGLYILFHANGSFELSRGAWEQFFDLRDKNFEKLRQKGDDQ